MVSTSSCVSCYVPNPKTHRLLRGEGSKDSASSSSKSGSTLVLSPNIFFNRLPKPRDLEDSDAVELPNPVDNLGLWLQEERITDQSLKLTRTTPFNQAHGR